MINFASVLMRSSFKIKQRIQKLKLPPGVAMTDLLFDLRYFTHPSAKFYRESK